MLELSKFTIAGDSIHYPGFVTEKIVQPFEHHSIPIYFGSTTITEDFNPDAFVWCKEEQDLEKTVEHVMALDQDDEAYIKMLTACPLPQEDFLEKKYRELEDFLLHIFEQPPEKAQRRVRYFCAAGHEKLLKDCVEKADKVRLIDRLYAYKKAAVKRFRGRK